VARGRLLPPRAPMGRCELVQSIRGWIPASASKREPEELRGHWILVEVKGQEEVEGSLGVRRGVSKGEEDGHMLEDLVHPQGIEALGMAVSSDTLGSPCPPLAIRPWKAQGGGEGRVNPLSSFGVSKNLNEEVTCHRV
jgi:hypothetical protein